MIWFGVACELPRDGCNDTEGLGYAIFQSFLPSYRNLMMSYCAIIQKVK